MRRTPEYEEGKKAFENFEEGMKVLFKVPKERVVRAEKKAKKKSASRRKQAPKPHPDKD
jgi:hypothetical protein